MEEIERNLDRYAPHQFTGPLLDNYVNILSAAIDSIRGTAKTGQNVVSREALLEYMREARKELSLAFVELNNKGVTTKFANHLIRGRGRLEKALEMW